MTALFFFLLLSARVLNAQQPIDTMALRAHTRFLSDDALSGRGTGTPGERIAGLYIESQLRRIGVSPAPGGYQQAVPLKRAAITATTLVVSSGRDSLRFDDRDFVINAGGGPSLRDFSGSALFVGTSEHALALRGVNLKGRVLILLGTMGADAGTLIPRWISQGVAGVIMLIPDREQFQLFTRSRGLARYYVDADVNDPIWQSALPVALGGPEVAAAFVAQLGPALSQLTRTGTPIELNRAASVQVRMQVESIPAYNVVGVIPGSDSVLRDEIVIYSAHFDHLGVSTPDARGDSIYNGFSDNAAGVAMLLAIAQEFKIRPPARSVVFAFFTGEERGLLGSSFYAERAAFSLNQTVAVINLDGGAPPAAPSSWRLAGGAANTIGALARDLATPKGWQLVPGDPSPNSDYWPFHARGVPSVFLIPGPEWDGVTPTQREALRARWDRYHRADDEWAEDFPFIGMQRYALLALEIGRAIANARERPRMLQN